MREKTSCVGEEKVNETSNKCWIFSKLREMAEMVADAMKKQSSLMATLTLLSLNLWFAKCIGWVFTISFFAELHWITQHGCHFLNAWMFLSAIMYYISNFCVELNWAIKQVLMSWWPLMASHLKHLVATLFSLDARI